MNNRQRFFRIGLAAAFFLSLFHFSVLRPVETALASCGVPANEIEAENCLTGTDPAIWDISGAGDASIQGFATDISVNRGGTIEFKIDTTAAEYKIDIYRLGYYAGKGARLIDTIPNSEVNAQDQPACNFSAENRNLLDCSNWFVSASWQVPGNATSGVYIARPERSDTHGASHIVFIVRDDASHSDLLFQTSDTTWQSYNPYGGYNAYGSSGATMAEKISYNRPFTTRGAELENFLFNAEYPMIRWLERNGYDVSYMSALDTERHASLIMNHKVFMSVGHDEYWSQGRRDAVTAARDAGVHLAFFSGNEIYWKIRWEDSVTSGTSFNPGDQRIQVVYKEGSAAPSGAVEHRNCYNNYECDPSGIWTGLWREAPGSTPENSLSGQISWRLNTAAITVPGEYAPLRFWRNTEVAGLAPNQELSLANGMLGYEWDPEYTQYAKWFPAGRIWLSTTDIPSFAGPEQHHLSLYRAPSGALVFGAGTVQWSWGLDGNHDRGTSDVDRNVQQATVNLLADMGAQPATLQAGLVAATASTDVTPPETAITSPSENAVFQVSSPFMITGTASDVDGVVAAVEISTDNGATWSPASGRGSWTYIYTPKAEGSLTILARAVDDSLNVDPTPASVTVTIEPRTCPCSMWDDSVVPPLASEPTAYELGVKFQVTEPGEITAIRFYKGAANTGEHSGRLWSADGTQLAAVTFEDETSEGWQQAQFATPVPVVPGVVYVASYHTTTGNYAFSERFFTQYVESPPLRLLADDENGPNGVYRQSNQPGYFPTSTYHASYYWVDVVFNRSGPDITPPQITQKSPADSATGVAVAAPVTARFNEPVKNLNENTFTLSGPGGPVTATVTYNPASLTATLTPSADLSYETAYTASIIGGAGASGVQDWADNDLPATVSWSFTTGSEPIPPDQGPGGPILIIADTGNPFGRYYAEILRNEGLNEFAVTDISLVTPSVLADYDVVLLADLSHTLTAGEVAMFTDWVTSGGNLIAMRPQSSLAELLGLSAPSGTLSNAYLRINTASAPGAGLVDETIQFHGAADLYTTPITATIVATLYSDAATPTANPAVTLTGAGAGKAAAFTYDLARSIVYTHQGNPAWDGDERDGNAPRRSNDLFYGAKAGDNQPDWVDLNKVAIPQADEQQRLLANLIVTMNLDKTPLPRFWYFPRGEKAVVIMTGDDHGSGGTSGRFAQQVTQSPAGCSVEDWECVRSTSYVFPGSITRSNAEYYQALGFEVSLHVNTNCSDWTSSSLRTFFANNIASFASLYPDIPLLTERNHCIAWSDYATQPVVENENGIRLDTNYYFWPPTWVNNKPGMFTGSGMPMRFARKNGEMIDVYQAATQMTDESGQTYPFTIDTLLDRALGPQGYYGAFTANMHTDSETHPQGNAIIASAQNRGVPIVSAAQMLKWLDGRNGSSFANLDWSANSLTFDIHAGSGANGLQAMVPAQTSAGTISGIMIDGTPVTYTLLTIKGIQYAVFNAGQGAVEASYEADETPPEVTAVSPDDGAVNVSTSAVVTATFNEPMAAATIYTNTFELRTGGSPVSAAISYNPATNTATLTPDALMTPYTVYSATLTTGVQDLAGNPLDEDYTWSFTTGSTAYSIWDPTATPASSPVNDNQPITVGTKFRANTAGAITALRFYKGAGDSDTHLGRLWTSAGVKLAEVTFTNETASGWQEMALPAPVSINANTTYVASIYSSPDGYFSITSGYFNTAHVNGPLRALAAGEDGPNGVFYYGNGFPSGGSQNNSNYWVDIVFETAPPDTTPPQITGVTATPVANEASIAWATDEPATSRVDYGANPGALDLSVQNLAHVETHSLTLTGLTPNTTYYYRVTSADEAGNTATYPAPPAAPLQFTTGMVFVDTTVDDFAAGDLGACYIAQSANGELTLGPTLGTEFDGIALPTDWISTTWTVGGTSTVEGGHIVVDGAMAAPRTYYSHGRSLEFVATFGAETYQNIGFGQTLETGNEYWALFGIGDTADGLYARTNVNGTVVNTRLIGNWLGAPHLYRIEWTASQIRFYIDDALVHTADVAITANMRPVISDYQYGGASLSVDWMRMSPYASPCVFTSRKFDSGGTVVWGNLDWDAKLPPGTSVVLRARTASTEAGLASAAWVVYPQSGTLISNPSGRWVQYQAELSTTDSLITPELKRVIIYYTNSPTAVILSSFAVTAHHDTAQLAWETASEMGLVGFNLYRSEAPDGVRHKLNAGLIPAEHPDQMIGTGYQYTDAVEPGKHYYYWLELFMSDGNELHGPLELITNFRLYLPLMSH